MGQPGPPSPPPRLGVRVELESGRAGSRPRFPDLKPRNVLDVSPATTSVSAASSHSEGCRMPLPAVSGGRTAPAHPSPSAPRFPTMPAIFRRVCTPPSIAFQPFRPERSLNSKCSLFTSCRGVIYPYISYELTTLAASQPNSNSCTPPSQGPHPSVSAELERCIMFDIPPRGYAPHPVRPHLEGSHQRRRPFSPVFVSVFGGHNAPPLQSPFRRPLTRWPRPRESASFRSAA